MSYSNKYELNVDLKFPMTSTAPVFKQGETAFLRFRLFDNGHHLDTTHYTYSEIVHKLPSGKKVMGNLDLVTVDSEKLLEYRYTGLEMAEIGKVEVQLVIQSEDTHVAIRPFKIVIVDDMRDDDLTYVGVLQELIAEVSLLKEEMYKAINSWVFRNSYSASTQYYRHNVVEYQGSSWIALRDTKGNTPPTLPTISNLNWYLLARKADNGVMSVNGFLPDTNGNVTIPIASTTNDGLITKEEKVKLSGISAGANFVKVDDNLTSTSSSNALSAKQGKELNDKKFDKAGGRINGYVHVGATSFSNKTISISGTSPSYGVLINTKWKMNTVTLGWANLLKLEGYTLGNGGSIPVSLSLFPFYDKPTNYLSLNVINNAVYQPIMKIGISNDSEQNILIFIDNSDKFWMTLGVGGMNLNSEMEFIDSNLELIGANSITNGQYLQ